ncbi:family 1 glycosylhydrolase [Vibrio tritonius]|uniref:family 1 glycosylhydrolase n=1 Tax=Vibrio tritonius TaxID=1435069 RepID=UPI000838A447|nr:family 1 glycosylhydrolase [Vibrio tritonius]
MQLPTISLPFLWGAASAGHQIEGNNINSDIWLMENLSTTVFKEPSGDACNSFELWEHDLDIAKEIGLNCYRFSLEWARIEPTAGTFSKAMIDHYLRIVKGCVDRGLEPIVTINHFSNPVWFAALGGWTNPQAPEIFTRYCDEIGKYFADKLSYVLTFNEPNILRTLNVLGMPEQVWNLQSEMLELAAKTMHCKKFSGLNACLRSDFDTIQENLIIGHRLARNVLKQYNSDLQVGFSLALLDDCALGGDSVRDAKREDNYGGWLRAASEADFVGVQNYERVVWNSEGVAPIPDDATTNKMGSWIDPTSLANCVKYINNVTGKPVMVTEHGIATDDDGLRCWFIESSLKELDILRTQGMPLLGYIHWTLIDNYEWVHGYDIHFGLCEVDRSTFKRTYKPSAYKYKSLIESRSQ